MRQQVATALVVCGTLIALMPSICDYLQGYQVSQFLSDRMVRPGITRINQPLGATFRASAWVLGGTMIGLGVLGGGRRQANPSEQNSDFGHDILVDGESPFREPQFAERLSARAGRRA